MTVTPSRVRRGMRVRLTSAAAASALIAGLASVLLSPSPASATSYPGAGPVMQRTASMPTADALPTTQIDDIALNQV